MGSLTLPTAGLIYLDTQAVIYSVEKHARYWPVLKPLWLSAKARTLRLVTSELTLLETLVGPLKSGNSALAARYERLLRSRSLQGVPVSRNILMEAARLRAAVGLKTPDAIHAATALESACTCLLGNYFSFRKLSGVSVVILDEVLKNVP